MNAMSKPLVQVPADYLTYEEAAKALGLQPTSLRAAISAGKLHPLKVQGLGRKFISRAEVDSYHARKGNRDFEREPAPANTFESPEGAQLREMVGVIVAIVTAPILDAYRESQVTTRETLATLAHVIPSAVGAAFHGSETAETSAPKTLAG